LFGQGLLLYVSVLSFAMFEVLAIVTVNGTAIQ
jgi:hypothetical protein